MEGQYYNTQFTNKMRTQEEIADIVQATCEAIETQLKGRANLNQDQIIANQKMFCKSKLLKHE